MIEYVSNMCLIHAAILLFTIFSYKKKPCLRWWNHSSMSLFWNAIVLTGDQAESSCKSRYQVAKNARPCVLRDSRQSNLIYPAWLRVAKNARCCVQRGVVVRQNSTLIEQLLFLKCCCSSGWIWTVTKIYWWDWWWELDIQGSHWDGKKLCKQ